MQTAVTLMLEGLKDAYPNINQQQAQEFQDLVISNVPIENFLQTILQEYGEPKSLNNEWIKKLETFFAESNDDLTAKRSQNLEQYQNQQLEILNLLGGFLQCADPSIDMASLRDSAMQMPVSTNKQAFPKLFDNFVSLVLSLNIQDTQDFALLDEAVTRKKEQQARIAQYRAEQQAILATITVGNPTQAFDWTVDHPIIPLLKQFDETLQRHLPEVHEQRNLGNSQEKIDKINEVLGDFKLPTPLAIFYQYFGGFSEEGIGNFGGLFGYPNVLTLDETYISYTRSIENKYLSHWSKAWYVIGDMDGDYLIVPMSKSAINDSPIYYFSCDDVTIRLYHESIQAMITTTLEAMEQGLIKLDEDNWLDIDLDELDNIRLKHSPNAFHYNDNSEPVGISYDYYDPKTWETEWQEYQTGKVDF